MASTSKVLTLLQLELLDTSLIWGDGGTLDADTVLLDSLGGLDGDLVIGLITVLQALNQPISDNSRTDTDGKQHTKS